MTNSNKAIKSERLMQYAKDFNADRANLVAANAAVSAGVLEAATDFDFDKAHGLEYGDSPSNHAMTITGVNLDEQGKPNRWKVENSWGKDNGEDGYYVASDAWFDRYVTEIIIRREYLDDATLALLEAEPVELDPWQPLTKRCR